MIPALSLVAGQDAVEKFTPQGSAEQHNIDINAQGFRSDEPVPPWPVNRGNDKNWRHSDLRVVAYPYVKRLYERLVSGGSLRQKAP